MDEHSTRDMREQSRLRAAEQAFPDWDFHQVFGGWEAVPKGSPVIRGMDLDSVVAKLRMRADQAAAAQ
jgi:hypothetical protein